MIRPIFITGDPVLHQPAKEVTEFNQELRNLVQDMYETMDEAPGVGLAAPQIGVPLRVFVYDWDAEDGSAQRGVVINPVLDLSEIPAGEPDWETESEGCLSVPGERFPIKRAQKATVRGLDLEQNPVVIEATGWFARIFQHEFDHLNGTLYVDRLVEPHKSDSQKIIAERGWGKPGLSWLPGEEKLEG
ncbi:MAG: peptide deformylase [Micrococcales bacterium]|nr:peptide deformylase [Micrococcales bacterium]